MTHALLATEPQVASSVHFHMGHFIAGYRWVIVLAAIGLAPTFVHAGAPGDPRWAHDVIVAKVKDVSAEPATNGNPAKVAVEITETLRGNLKGTLVTIWSGREHDVDWGEPSKNPIVIKWAAEKAEKPKVGESYILYGTLYPQKDKDGKESKFFYTRVGGRLPLNDKNRSDVIESIRIDEIRRKEAIERQAVEAGKRLARIKEWRAGMTDEKLAAAVGEAGFVAIGKITGYQIPENIYTFQVSEVLKGRKRVRLKDERPGKPSEARAHFLSVIISKDVAALLDRESQYVLLLSEKGLVARLTELEYQPVGDGVVLADAAALKLVRGSTKDLAGEGPPAIMMYPNEPELAGALEKAAGGKLTVIRSPHTRADVPMSGLKPDDFDATFWLRVERTSKGIHLQLARSGAVDKLLMDKTLIDPDPAALADQAAKIVATVLEAK